MASNLSKSVSVLELYTLLESGCVINKHEIAEKFQVNSRSIQRYIGEIKEFLSEQRTQTGIFRSIEYDTKADGYKMVTHEKIHLSEGEMLAVCKILLESRAFTKEQITSLIKRIAQFCIVPQNRRQIEGLISNELVCYIDPAHSPVNMTDIWTIAEAINSQHLLEIKYTKLKDKATVKRILEPVGILFSEYYFYLLGIMPDPEERKCFEQIDDPFPTIYRIDRIKSIKVCDDKFDIPYRDRFKSGEYKNRIQFMFGGTPQTVEFNYYGMSIEAVLDKLPLAEVTPISGNGGYRVKAEIFGKGILMWLLSQGSKVNVLQPADLREAWIKELEAALSRLDTPHL